jgi:hypothetical protein
MRRVVYGKAWEPERYDLLDLTSEPVFSEIIEPVGKIGSKLMSESVLGRKDNICLMAGFLEG